MAKFIYIYNDIGVSEVGVASLALAIKHYLNLEVKVIDAEQLIKNDLIDAVALIIPGGADLPYCAKLNGAGNRIIRNFVENGGLYIGICAGAYYACDYVDFIGKEYQVQGERELCFFQGVAKGSLSHLANDHLFDETVNSKTMISLQFEDFTHSQPLYYHGGSTFIPYANYHDYQVIARYPDQQPAIISGKFGQGQYFLSGVHFELQAETYRQFVLDRIVDPAIYSLEEHICQQLEWSYGVDIWQRLYTLIKTGS